MGAVTNCLSRVEALARLPAVPHLNSTLCHESSVQSPRPRVRIRRQTIDRSPPADTAWKQIELVTLPTCNAVWQGLPQFKGTVQGWHLGPWWAVEIPASPRTGRFALRWELSDGTTGQSEGFDIKTQTS